MISYFTKKGRALYGGQVRGKRGGYPVRGYFGRPLGLAKAYIGCGACKRRLGLCLFFDLLGNIGILGRGYVGVFGEGGLGRP